MMCMENVTGVFGIRIFLIFFCEFLVVFSSMTFSANIQKHGTWWKLTNQRAAFWQKATLKTSEGVSTMFPVNP